MVYGEPDIDFRKLEDGRYQVEIKGVDILNPNTGELTPSSPDDIACWFLDTDYDEGGFFVRHAYFLGGKDPYEKLAKALKAEHARAGNPDSAEYNACVREAVDELLARETSSRHPGMLLGKIQSGKTRAFLGIIALAFDRGFDVAVVLTKGTRTLGNQTVRRISSEFKPFRDDNVLQVLDILRIPNLTPWELEEQKLVIVAKKEHNNMRRLIELFASTHPGLRGKRVLIIDDEADFSSVRLAKKKGSDAIDQGKIASQIDELRRELSRCAFLQVTATPYALYLQPDEYETPSGANMTFEPKRPAFTKLVPIHSAYVGGDHYFGDHDEGQPEYYLWHEVEQIELDALKKEDRRRFGIEEVLTTDKVKALRSALANFVTAGAIRRLQQRATGQRPKHYAMIVHVETSRLAHDWQHRVAQAVLDKMKAANVNGAGDDVRACPPTTF